MGVEVKKLCFNRDKIEPVVLFFSQDFQFVGVYTSHKNAMQVYSLKMLISADSGFRSTRLLKYLKDGYYLDERLCFTLIFHDRSFDFIAASQHMRDSIVTSINRMQN